MKLPKIESGGGDFSVYRQQGRRYTKMTITLSAVCLIFGGLIRSVWDISEYSHLQDELLVRVTNLEAAYKTQASAIDSDQRELAEATDRTVDTKTRLVALEVALNQANATLQKLSESNARLEERVIFLVAQVEGRMTDQGSSRKRR